MLIREALWEIEAFTCIRFLEGSNQNYVLITNKYVGCFSWVGLKGDGWQPVNLGRGCMEKGIIIHEFLHSLGFFHQQSSADRDNFVTINIKNAEPDAESQFDKYSDEEVTNFGFKYDYDSIMHYGPTEFSSNGEPVIVAKFSGAENMGQRITLSRIDIAKINKMYNCRAY